MFRHQSVYAEDGTIKISFFLTGRSVPYQVQKNDIRDPNDVPELPFPTFNWNAMKKCNITVGKLNVQTITFEEETEEIDSNENYQNKIISEEIDSNNIDSNDFESNEIESNDISLNEDYSSSSAKTESNKHKSKTYGNITNDNDSKEIDCNKIISNEIISKDICSNEISSNVIDLNKGCSSSNSQIEFNKHKSNRFKFATIKLLGEIYQERLPLFSMKNKSISRRNVLSSRVSGNGNLNEWGWQIFRKNGLPLRLVL